MKQFTLAPNFSLFLAMPDVPTCVAGVTGGNVFLTADAEGGATPLARRGSAACRPVRRLLK
jgi:hypothetical protein